MRLLLIIIFTFNFQSLAMSEVNIGNLFGVKILDDVKLYANVKDGVEHDVRPDILYFSDEVIDIERNEDFDRFYLRTDNKFKIINITGKRFLAEKNKTFVNNCLIEKNKLIEDLSIFFSSTKNEFEQKYWHWPKFKSIWDESQLFYEEEGNKYLLSIHCSYRKSNDMIGAELGVSWVTYNYYTKYIKDLWKKIDKFDDQFIKSYTSVSENI
jgi:hypothetical protein